MKKDEKQDRSERGCLKRGPWLQPIQYSIPELTVVMGAGKTTISNWIKDGKLPSYKIGGMVFVHRDDVEAFVEKYRRGQDFDL